jgi:hypothetical protein
MSSYKQLTTLLGVKRALEDKAERALAGKIRARVESEARQVQLDGEAFRAREALRAVRGRTVEAGRPGAIGVPETGEAALVRQRFWERLADEVRVRAAGSVAHRQSALREALAAEAAVRAAHLVARREREAVEKQMERLAAAQKRIAERREEQALDEQGEASRRK